MKKILLGSSALLAFSTLAVAHTRDGMVAAGGDTVELSIEGGVDVYQAYRSGSVEYKNYENNPNVVVGETSFFDGGKSFVTPTFTFLNADGVANRTLTPTIAADFEFDEELGLYSSMYGMDRSFDSFGQTWDADVDFVARTHWNGLEFVGNIDLDLSPNGNKLDKAYIDIISEKYGTLRMGKGATVSDELMITAGTPFDEFDEDDDELPTLFGIGDTITVDTANEIAYMSPVYNGFQFGIGFEFANDNGILGNGNTTWEFEDFDSDDDDILTGSAIQLAAVFRNEFNAFSYGVSAAARWALGDTYFMDREYEQEYFVGLELGYMGFTWINTYHYALDEADGEIYKLYADQEEHNYKTSLEWNWGAWTTGIGYQHAWGEDYRIGNVTSYNVVDGTIAGYSGAEYTTDRFDIGVEREIVGGVTVGASMAYVVSEVEDYVEVDGVQFTTGIEMEW